MASLKSRQTQIPGGFKFHLPELNWHGPPFSSFNTLVDAVVQLVAKNPWLAKKNGWPTDRNGVERWVEQYQCSLCLANGWHDYITQMEGDTEPPKSVPPEFMARLQAVAGAVRKLEAGVQVLLDWEVSGEPPVDRGTAECRALICHLCPKNKPGHMTSWFTIPASEVIRQKLDRLHGLKLFTSVDEKLGVCEACLCPLKLKVHTPLDLCRKHLTPEVKADLDPRCWML